MKKGISEIQITPSSKCSAGKGSKHQSSKSKNARIHVARHSGFCFGVRRAIQIAKENSPKKNVFIKGTLVHNEQVCADIAKLGIRKVDSLSCLPKDATIIIKAHGEPVATYKKLKQRRLNVVDATCPMVKEIHEKAGWLEKLGYQIIIIGDSLHEETKGILGHASSGLIIEDEASVYKLKAKLSKKIGIVCQSTQSQENVSSIVAAISGLTEEMLFFNTICQPTRLRQKEIKELALMCEAVLIVGSNKSANTKRLFEVSKRLNKNSFWIDSPCNVNKKMFASFGSVGIIGGASTPQAMLEDIRRRLS